MSIRNTENSYGSLAKWFHWIGAILIIGMLIYGTIFSTLVSNEKLKGQLIYIHKSFGLLILTLIIVRWIWRCLNPKPKVLSITNPTLVKATHWFHELLYLAIVIMIASGMLLSGFKHYCIPFFWLFEIKTTWLPKNHAWHEFFEDIHQIFAWVITVMLVLHVFVAIRHHVVKKDGTLRRMWI